MTKYLTGASLWATLIKPIEVERETDSSVWIDGRRHKKMSEWDKYFDTWDEAHKYLTEMWERRVRQAQSDMDSAKAKLAKVKALKETT